MAPRSSSKSRSEKGAPAAQPPKPKDFASHGVKDNDIFLLPGSDFQTLGAITVLALAVRLYRIYQPSSVVFDEVQ